MCEREAQRHKVLTQIFTNSYALKALWILAQGWNTVTTLGLTSHKYIPSPIGWEKVAGGRMRVVWVRITFFEDENEDEDEGQSLFFRQPFHPLCRVAS
jgi:hypothetical protein